MEVKHTGNRRRPRKSTQNSTTIIINNNNNNKSTSSTPKKKRDENKISDELKKIKLQMQGSSSSSICESVYAIAKASDLPCSILIDVLARLPLKTLFDCRYVCKSWRSLLTESYFYRLYSQHMPTTLILRLEDNSLDTLKKITLVEQQDESLATKMQLVGKRRKTKAKLQKLGLLQPNTRFQLGNRCNGLICLQEVQTREPSLVWNPILGQFVILPKPNTTTDNKLLVAGFGFCSPTNRYKVLRIFHRVGDPLWKQRAEIYDLGVGNEWREIGSVPFSLPSKIPGFFINNLLHWILDYNSDGEGDTNKYVESNILSSNVELICGFDFVEEKFKAISSPPIFSLEGKNMYHWSNLGIIGNYLSICAIDAKIFRPDVQVWVMEEYGVAESWALRLSIRDPAVDWWDPYRWMQLTNSVNNGEIVMLCAHYYVLAYNLQQRRFRKVEGLDFAAIAHVPSFISLESVLNERNGTGSLNVFYL